MRPPAVARLRMTERLRRRDSLGRPARRVSGDSDRAQAESVLNPSDEHGEDEEVSDRHGAAHDPELSTVGGVGKLDVNS